MYVAVKGGEQAIAAAHRLQAQKRRGDSRVTELSVAQIEQQLAGSVDRVMTEGGIYDKQLAALAIKQAAGDLVEAIFLLRAYRTTLPRLAVLEPVDTTAMKVERRISAAYKDLPGGQVLGPTYDYTHRLLDFALLAENDSSQSEKANAEHNSGHSADNSTRPEQDFTRCPQVMSMLERLQLVVEEQDQQQAPSDITEQPIDYPCDRSARLQQLVRGDEGYLLALGYSTQRGYGRNHPFAGEIRSGKVSLCLDSEELGFEIEIGELELTECQMINGFEASEQQRARFTRGYGLSMGFTERKAMSMALVDRALQSRERGEAVDGPAQDEEFVLAHADNVEAAGFVSHLKLPHYVDFQSELALLRDLHKAYDQQLTNAPHAEPISSQEEQDV
ncbi:carbon-phosphorus lyase complex subunit PhnI [Aliagarivorans marinus]|uniref:carbon-phosphorus lyase complex subunit PhnI n=1 Tax=Aliagarivorans marinus TaxID=561965 RepID=UPI00040117A4|nr:carbon-phosphorus lyase complex subunit PhnI [Aliagarivorans marinus]